MMNPIESSFFWSLMIRHANYSHQSGTTVTRKKEKSVSPTNLTAIMLKNHCRSFALETID